MKSNSGMNSKSSCVVKRMWRIFAKQKQRNSLSTISICLRKKPVLNLPLLSKRKDHHHHQNQEQKAYVKGA